MGARLGRGQAACPGKLASSTKGAIVSVTRSLAVEPGSEVRVNAVLPGGILTAAWEGRSKTEREELALQTAVGRLGRPDEVGGSSLLPRPEEASYVRGASGVVDRGYANTK